MTSEIDKLKHLNPYYRSAYNIPKRRKQWQIFIILLLNLRIYFLS